MLGVRKLVQIKSDAQAQITRSSEEEHILLKDAIAALQSEKMKPMLNQLNAHCHVCIHCFNAFVVLLKWHKAITGSANCGQDQRRTT